VAAGASGRKNGFHREWGDIPVDRRGIDKTFGKLPPDKVERKGEHARARRAAWLKSLRRLPERRRGKPRPAGPKKEDKVREVRTSDRRNDLPQKAKALHEKGASPRAVGGGKKGLPSRAKGKEGGLQEETRLDRKGEKYPD